mgnify:CR=1 FL=1
MRVLVTGAGGQLGLDTVAACAAAGDDVVGATRADLERVHPAAYLDRIDSYVKNAAAHGIYTVIDMHQDAYTAFLHTQLASECTDGTTPAKGFL